MPQRRTGGQRHHLRMIGAKMRIGAVHMHRPPRRIAMLALHHRLEIGHQRGDRRTPQRQEMRAQHPLPRIEPQNIPACINAVRRRVEPAVEDIPVCRVQRIEYTRRASLEIIAKIEIVLADRDPPGPCLARRTQNFQVAQETPPRPDARKPARRVSGRTAAKSVTPGSSYANPIRCNCRANSRRLS